MTQKKSKDKKVKPGPKSGNEKSRIDRELRVLFDKDGITPWNASLEAKCSYPYACQKFKEFGEELVETEKEDWLDRNDKVRKRALQGLANRIKNSEKVLDRLEGQRKEAKTIYDAIIPNMVSNVKSKLGDYIKQIDDKLVFELFSFISKDLDLHKNYGYYIASLEGTIRAREQFGAELQAHYDTIEILPPPSAVLERLIEQRIAEKNKLKENSNFRDPR